MEPVVTRHRGDLLFATQMGRHTLLADVPAKVGGQDRGPTGLQLLLGALSSCIAAMVVFAGLRAGIDTTDLSVEVTGERVTDPIRLTDMRVTVRVPHCADAAQREALRQAAEQCPVHETMMSFDRWTLTVTD